MPSLTPRTPVLGLPAMPPSLATLTSWGAARLRPPRTAEVQTPRRQGGDLDPEPSMPCCRPGQPSAQAGPSLPRAEDAAVPAVHTALKQTLVCRAGRALAGWPPRGLPHCSPGPLGPQGWPVAFLPLTGDLSTLSLSLWELGLCARAWDSGLWMGPPTATEVQVCYGFGAAFSGQETVPPPCPPAPRCRACLCCGSDWRPPWRRSVCAPRTPASWPPQAVLGRCRQSLRVPSVSALGCLFLWALQ